jgi:diguanylate cyclase (GGDEF)-like protein
MEKSRGTVALPKQEYQHLSENELLLLFDNMISPLSYYRMVYDAEGKPVDYIILAVNTAFEQETGMKREDVIGKNVLSIYPKTESYWIECFGRVAKTGVSERITQYSSELKKWYNGVAYCPREGHVALTLTDITQYVFERNKLEQSTVELKTQQAQIDQLAHVEPISGLPNRACLYDAFAARVADGNGTPFTLAIFGPDNLAEVLASYGSTMSDRVMHAVAQRLHVLCEKGFAFFSMTGTDLVLLMPAMESKEQTKERLMRFQQAIREPVEEDGTSFFISATCGVAEYPADGTDRDDIIMKANLALYQAKKSGEHTRFYEAQIGNMLLRRMQIRNALPKALNDGEFELYYQPQFELVSGNIIGVEALLRWHSPELGEVSPAEFIPIAEKSLLILPIGRWVYQTACEAVKRIERERNIVLRMAVNVSGVQLIQEGFCERVMNRLQEFDLAPERIELEITESVLINKETNALNQLNRLSALGVRIALDDFGTGYSTMSLLKDLHVSTIKIDRSFIQDASAQVMNRVLVRLGHILGAKVVAEGVETQEELKRVQRIKCDMVQGFLLSVPLPLNELLSLLEKLQTDAILL